MSPARQPSKGKRWVPKPGDRVVTQTTAHFSTVTLPAGTIATVIERVKGRGGRRPQLRVKVDAHPNQTFWFGQSSTIPAGQASAPPTPSLAPTPVRSLDDPAPRPTNGLPALAAALALVAVRQGAAGAPVAVTLTRYRLRPLLLQAGYTAAQADGLLDRAMGADRDGLDLRCKTLLLRVLREAGFRVLAGHTVGPSGSRSDGWRISPPGQ